MSYLIPAIPIINKWNKVNKSLYPKTNCTAIVLFNYKLDSTLVRSRKTYGQLILETRTYPIMNVLYTLFIQDGKKVIKEELYFLSSVALAFWIMSDGVRSLQLSTG